MEGIKGLTGRARETDTLREIPYAPLRTPMKRRLPAAPSGWSPSAFPSVMPVPPAQSTRPATISSPPGSLLRPPAPSTNMDATPMLRADTQRMCPGTAVPIVRGWHPSSPAVLFWRPRCHVLLQPPQETSVHPNLYTPLAQSFPHCFSSSVSFLKGVCLRRPQMFDEEMNSAK